MKYFILLTAFFSLNAACNSQVQTNSKTTSTMNTAPASENTTPVLPENLELATLGGGCFWCVEAIYQDLKGVTKVESGYSGGEIDNPSYREVCSGLSGHAEVIQVTFDRTQISFRDILDVFFTVHDPTTLNRQGNDVGTQYRSVIYYHSPEQMEIAQAAKTAAGEIWDDPIVTEISPYGKFFKAEDYHQNYFKDNQNQPYCSIVIAPKVRKFRDKYKDKLKQ